MKHIIVLHDAFTNPTEYWYPQILSIAPAGYSVVTPELPTGAQQGMEYWMKDLEQYRSLINNNTIIISHGVASLLALRFIETFSEPIRTYISVAGCAEVPTHKALTPIAETFLQSKFDWEKIKNNISTTVHIWNKSDPFIETEKSKQFAELLKGDTKILTESSHFTEYNEIDLLTELQNIFQNIQKIDERNEALKALQVQQQEKEQIAKATISNIVTYDTDVAQSVAGYQGKVISELLTKARIEEAEKKEESVKNPKNIFYLLGSIVLLLGGLGLITYGIIPLLPKMVQIIQPSTKKYESILLRVDTIKPLELSEVKDFQLRDQLKAVQATDVSEKSFVSIVPTFSGEKTNLQTFAATYDLKFPLGFADKANDYIYGYYRPEGKEKIPFLLISFEGYDIMYSIMRNWEDTIIGGTFTLFAPEKSVGKLMRAETTVFKDVVINNIPLRTGIISSGESITYGFLTDQTLLITTSTDVAEPILRRMIGR